MQEPVVVLCYLGTSVHTHTCDFKGCPYRVAGEQLVVGLNSRKFYHAEFHNHMVDQLLCLFFSQGAVLKITLDVDVEESRNTANAHCCAVLSLDRSEVSEIQPLNSLFCILCRLGNVVAVGLGHLFHLL